MMVNTDLLVGMTEANQNFSKVARLVDEAGMAVILKNNKPKYMIVDFDEYEIFNALRSERNRKIKETAEHILDENMEAFMELAK